MIDVLRTLDDLRSLCDSNVAEGLQLEFKLKENADFPDLGKLDKRAIAEAVSSFANSDGGTLVYGIGTERRGGADVAVKLVPIAEIDRFLSNFKLVCSLNISPELSSVAIWVIYSDSTQTAGFLVCRVERSDSRPHMSTAAGVHSYFRRSFDGSALMTPSEIKDQILAVREALLQPTISAAGSVAFTDLDETLILRASFRFGLSNAGTRICKNPFLRTGCNRTTRSHDAIFDRRLSAWKADVPPGVLIHVDDARHFFSLEFSAAIRVSDLRLERGSEDELLQAVRIYESTNPPDAQRVLSQDEVDDFVFRVTFGAENATARVEIIKFDRDELARHILVRSEAQMRDIVIGRVGTWRSDLVEKLRNETARMQENAGT
ncbi:MAG TPA: ATP-binding protein [Allosphingosinicella sp.]